MATYSLGPIGVSGNSISASINGAITNRDVTGIGAAGNAFGSYTDGGGSHGFVYRGGYVTPISIAGATST